MEDSVRMLLVFVIMIGFFPIFYLFLPVYIIFGASVAIAGLGVYQAVKMKEYGFVIPMLLFTAISAFFVIRYTAAMSLLLVSDILLVNEAIAISHVVVLFVEYLPLLIVFIAAFAILYAWGFVQPGRAAISRYARTIGYIGIFLMVTFVYLDMMVWDPGTASGEIALDDVFFELPLFGGNPIKITYELWYFIQFTVWTMSAYTFITGFLLSLTGGE